MNYPDYDIFKLTNQLHLPRPQPSDFAYDYFNGKKNGFFVDIGAAEGILCNNSVSFERGYGWTGICIEANPITFKKLKKNRPNTICHNVGIGEKNEILDFWAVDGEAACLSGFEKFMSEDHKQRVLNDVRNNKDDFEVIKIQSIPFNDIHFLPKKVDYLSIDTEGADLTIIKSINFEDVIFDLISVEADHSFDQIKDILEHKNFNHIGNCCNDKFFKYNG